MNPFIRHLSQDFNKRMEHLAGPLYKQKSYLVAMSGGCDSMALAHLAMMSELKIQIVHCNYKLRGDESMDDEMFVAEFFKSKNIPLQIKRFETKEIAKKTKQSTQVFARRLRYEWFEQICTHEKIDYILTGHNYDDKVETFILNLSRGSGPKGLRGIPEKNGRVLRPLLNMSKEEIRSFCKIQNIPFREDSSNTDNKYKRNFVRNEVLPLLTSQISAFKQNVGVTMDIMGQYYEFVNDKVQRELENNISVNDYGSRLHLNKISDTALKHFVVRSFLEDRGFSMSDIDDMNHALEILKSGIKIISRDLSYAISDRNKIVYINKLIEVEPVEFELKPGEIKLWNGRLVISKGSLENQSPNKISLPSKLVNIIVNIRTKKDGDRIRSLGMNGSQQKLQDIFTNSKLDYLDKQLQPVLDINEEIVWVVGIKRSEKYQAETGEEEFVLEWVRKY